MNDLDGQGTVAKKSWTTLGGFNAGHWRSSQRVHLQINLLPKSTCHEPILEYQLIHWASSSSRLSNPVAHRLII